MGAKEKEVSKDVWSSRQKSEEVFPKKHCHSQEDQKFNPALHGMVSEALGFRAWNGNWMDLDDWFQIWKLYTQSTYMPPSASALIFISKMPDQHSQFLTRQHAKEGWHVTG